MKAGARKAVLMVVTGMLATAVWSQTCNPATTPTAPNSRFVIQAGGSEVLDKATGLRWQRCVLGQSWNGNTCAGTPELLTWPLALAKVKSLGAFWRLPNIKELVGLAEMSCEPAMNLVVFPTENVRVNDVGYYQWTSTPTQDEALAYAVYGWRITGRLTGNGSAQIRLVK